MLSFFDTYILEQAIFFIKFLFKDITWEIFLLNRTVEFFDLIVPLHYLYLSQNFMIVNFILWLIYLLIWFVLLFSI